MGEMNCPYRRCPKLDYGTCSSLYVSFNMEDGGSPDDTPEPFIKVLANDDIDDAILIFEREKGRAMGVGWTLARNDQAYGFGFVVKGYLKQRPGRSTGKLLPHQGEWVLSGAHPDIAVGEGHLVTSRKIIKGHLILFHWNIKDGSCHVILRRGK